ncbi:hypothetical protein GURKE_00160 [Brevundimonas phage vB_BpoS-Gurke]|uniref:Uncharacterized protein n=1 Tax=Brevundimonas phage vB_BpoS-Gurke TaxID=2948599 RepID=A0A9E7N390_9CAUD|nr:hypothetical protein GURKE_00160 [Brevundimonas phage vB_BpoS-Gurke]
MWKTVTDDEKPVLVDRLISREAWDAGSSLHVAEVHVVDVDGTVYRYFRALSDLTGVSVKDEIERWDGVPFSCP